MTKDHDDWDTGEFEPIKPVAPSTRGRPQPTPATPVKTDDDTADHQDQRHDGE